MSVAIQIQAPIRLLALGLQLVLDRVGTALTALEGWARSGKKRPSLPDGVTAAIGLNVKANVPGTNFPIQLAPALSHQDGLDETRRWILFTGSSDTIGFVSEFLAGIRILLAAISVLERDGTVSASRLREVTSRTSKAGRHFDGAGVPEKLALLDELGLPKSSTLGTLRAMLLSINKARNCLEHRLGLVHPSDVNDKTSDALVVCWQAPVFGVSQRDGTKREASTGRIIKARRGMTFGTVDRTKIFAIGSRVDFASQAFQEQLWTLKRFGEEVTKAVGDIAESRTIIP
jgi:hypothetical protein